MGGDEGGRRRGGGGGEGLRQRDERRGMRREMKEGDRDEKGEE
jgi:hypothetical protein